MSESRKYSWKHQPWEDISKSDWHQILKARIDVFVVEQNCPYPEIDGKDEQGSHLFAMDDATGAVLAYLRILPEGVSYAEISFGRVLTTMPARGRGFGSQLMDRAVGWLKSAAARKGVRISAQVQQMEWYAQWGFEPVGETYLEDDIPHIEMLRKP